jgi:hypothetical protein
VPITIVELSVTSATNIIRSINEKSRGAEGWISCAKQPSTSRLRRRYRLRRWDSPTFEDGNCKSLILKEGGKEGLKIHLRCSNENAGSPLSAAVVHHGSAGHKLTYVYFEEEPGRRLAAKLLTKDEARRIAANIAKLASILRED